MGKGSAPDMSGQNSAALQQATLSKEQLDWAKQIYGESAPDRAAASQRATAVSNAQLTAMGEQSALTRDYSDYQKNTFRPLEQGIVNDAASYDSPDRREAEAARAVADVQQAISGQRNIAMRDMERSGIDPSSGRAMALQNQAVLSGAAMQAGAANRSRAQVETIGAARKADAANLGRNLASNQATSAGIALNQGNASVNNAMQPGAVTAQGAALMNSGYSGAQQGLAGAANTYGQINNAQNQASQSNNGIWTALGSAAGAY